MEEEKTPNPVEYYLMTVNIKVGREGCDLVGTIKKLSELLRDYSNYTKCLYRFKVTGEAKILALFEVSNVIGLERMLNGLTLSGHVDVSCDPLVEYEDFGKMIGVDPSLTQPSPRNLTGNKCLWAEFTVEYPGKTIEELMSIWKAEASAVLGSRQQKGSNMELFKVCGARKVHVFIERTIKEWDDLTFRLPLMRENGDNVQIVTKGVQNLDNYVETISE